MSSSLPSFLRLEKGKYIVDCSKLEVYIPAEYLDGEMELATMTGKSMTVIGIFNLRAFSSDKDKKGKLYSLNLPMEITLNVEDNRQDTIQVRKGSDPGDYIILSYEKGDVIIPDDNVIISEQSLRKFVKLINGGKLPEGIRYRDLLQTYHSAMESGGVSLGVQSLLLEITISELCRDAKNPSRPFRMRAGKEGDDESQFKMFSIKKIPQLSSTFAALAFEDVNESISSSIHRTRSGKDEKESPIEKTIYY